MTTKSQASTTKTIKPAAEAAPAPRAARVHAKDSTPKKPTTTPLAKPRRTAVAGSGSKIDTVVNMLRAKQGASLEQLSKATGWQHHSVRGAISGHVKKKLGLNVTSERVKGVRTYRIGK